ncbi:methyl-accepting chemotaxis protein [Mongoliimonas terrestris]|uniref:methyl-accepting chemotaxis protein n=1 Tax=Mongoliimonas terrestris TaxID=1709001 RepID=UPI0009498340|nr:HAMP domain-containing methyl-accepting chemotaxis protein [Mongoliimonas terrestris]
MESLRNLSLLQKIAIPVTVLVLVLATVVFLAADGLTTLAATTDRVIDVSAERKALLAELEAVVNEATIQEKNIIINTDVQVLAGNKKDFDSAEGDLSRVTDRLIELADTEDRRRANEQIRDSVHAYYSILGRSIALGMNNQNEEARLISVGEGRTARVALRELLGTRQEKVAAELEGEKNAAEKLALDTKTTLIGSAALGSVVSVVFLAWMIVGMVTRPVNGVTSAFDALAGGNLDVAVTGVDRKDEVGRLARSLQVFKNNAVEARRLAAEQEAENAAKMRRAQALDSLTKAFEKTVGQLTGSLSAAATEMEATAESMTGVADKTNRTSSGVATAAQQTSANVQTVAASTEELAASIKEIASQVHQSRSVTEQAVSSAREADVKVRGLAEAAERIGDIVELINTIAAQTNLLALNATIEAARAGDAGRGFAVVAAEVKELANQTAKATADIGSQIGSIRTSTTEVVHAIEEFGSVIGQVSQTSTIIAAAIEEQDSATLEISRNVQQAAQGTEEVTSNILSVQYDAGQTGAAATQVLGAARELAKHSSDLRREVDGFLAGVKAA